MRVNTTKFRKDPIKKKKEYKAIKHIKKHLL
jgi:hypothetical protein